jgi:hypothetical protein
MRDRGHRAEVLVVENPATILLGADLGSEILELG